jgi:hypothetical protein
MSVHISKTNSKLGVIPSVNLPPIVTCRAGCPCSKHCYATKGRFRFSNVISAMNNNYAEYIENPSQYFYEIQNAINNGMVSYSYFRWHASGDIVDALYFRGMVEVSNRLPNTSFLAFTKKFEIVNQYISNGGVIPDNLHIVFSSWGTSLNVDNPHNFPVAYVRFSDENENATIPENAEECLGNCQECLKCWHIKSGQSVVFNLH